MISAVLFIAFFVFLILGAPIAICLGLSSVCAILASGTSLTIVATNMYSGISKFLLLAIPFFVLSGNIMAKAGISKRLIKFVDTCVGHKRGGIAIVCVIVACFFGAISGSGPATVAALGAVLIPAMIESGFSAPFSTALMATASSIAIVIPPSIAFVVYASITGVSIADMFSAGIIPGILMGVALVVVVMLEARKNNMQVAQKKATAGERWAAFKDAFWGFLMPVIILGGIYGGIFTPTEAAAVSVVYGLFVGMVIYREVTFKDLIDILIDSGKTTGGIMIIVACASLFSFVCTKFGIAEAASALLGKVAVNQFVFLLICNIIFLIAGCFIDANSAMYIFIPIMLPVCKALGYDVVAFGVMATVNLAIGQVTPPVGVNLFVAISVKLKKGMQVTLQQISKAVVPQIIASVVVLMLITYVPQISTVLPKAFAGSTYSGAVEVKEESASVDNGDAEGNSFDTVADYSDLEWPEMTLNFACSTTDTSTWALAGQKFGELMEQATGGKITVNVYASDQLTNGNQSEGIQALMNGDPVQISMHSNLIYSAFDARFNVVSLPFIYDSLEDADAKFDGEAGEMMKAILDEYGLHCMGIAENGFRQLTNSVHEIKSVEDMKNLKIRVAGSNLLMECYKLWGADATNMNWSETYTALQQNTVEGQENPLPAIDSASVQEVQDYCAMWNAIYDCLFFCMNQEIYDSFTPEQRAVIDEVGQKAVEYQRYINRAGDEEIKTRWTEENGVTITELADIDIESFKAAVDCVDEWYVEELKAQGFEDAEALVEAFTGEDVEETSDEASENVQATDGASAAEVSMDDYSDLGWEEMTWNFACSTTDTSTWALAGQKFGELMEQATGGKVNVKVYASDQLTNGNQSEGIQALMDGDPVQISMHSNLIYSAFDARFNVVSLPFIYDSLAEADAKFDGEAGDMMKEILGEYGLHCMGIAENGFRQLTNNVHEIKSVDDMKNLKIRVAGSNLLMECYKLWGADATNMNWSETYTALQQNTVEGQENPLPAIDSASVQEVQDYCSMWNSIYDCLFFCINQELYDSLTPEQQAVVDEAGQKAVEYQRYINRAGDEEIKTRWTEEDGVTITELEDIDIESFKAAVDGVDEWYIAELESQGFEDAKELVETFVKDVEVETADAVDSDEEADSDTAVVLDASAADVSMDDYSDLDWPETVLNFACSTTDTSTWALAGQKFGELMEQATGGKVTVKVYASDQLTNGNQSEGIQALMDGDPVQISMHSNLIYSAFDARFNVVSLPFIYESLADADAKFDGEAGDMMKEILGEYGLHCMGIAENGFRQLTNNVHEIKSVEDMKNLKIRVAGSNLLMECYKLWGADATNMNWSETYTALQQNTVEGQENPLPAIDSASVQEVQDYCSMWNAIYDCLFFCINQELYDSFTPEQQAVIDEAGQKAVEYQRYINRAGDEEIKTRWTEENGVTITELEDIDIESFKAAVDGVDEWYVEELEKQGFENVEELVAAFTAA